MTTITKDNYYDVRDILSASTIKAFANCEAAALAELKGEYSRPTSTALLVGSYIDAALDSDAELDKFLSSHPEIVNSRTGALKADFQRAADIVARCKEDALFRSLTVDSPAEGHQYIVVGTIGTDSNGASIPCKGKLDFLLMPDYLEQLAARFPGWAAFFRSAAQAGGLIIDLKSAANTDEVWDPDAEERLPWLQSWHYDRQLAIYRELYRQRSGHVLPVLVLVATKEPATSLLALTIDSGTLDEGLADARMLAPEAWAVMRGEAEPCRCGHCAYCRAQRKLAQMGPIDFRFAAGF